VHEREEKQEEETAGCSGMRGLLARIPSRCATARGDEEAKERRKRASGGS
jgi:hypothetical protein